MRAAAAQSVIKSYYANLVSEDTLTEIAPRYAKAIARSFDIIGKIASGALSLLNGSSLTTALAALVRSGEASPVELVDEDTEEAVCYQIVGEDEADIKVGMISINSPIARALIAKMEGDLVSVVVPGGERSLEIVEVRYE